MVDLKSIQIMQRKQDLRSRIRSFYEITSNENHTYFRVVVSPMDREVLVIDPASGEARFMLMFASNNYLGLSNHPYVKEKVMRSINEFGCGVGGPPLLNGYNTLIREAEERLAAWKKQEDAVIFSSGFATNLGIIGAITRSRDLILFDELSHASFYDGVRYSNAHAIPFEHNNMEALEDLLAAHQPKPGSTVFVGAEGVYSMDGDKAPLDRLSRLCKKHNAISIIDDAHGSGVLGKNGAGTADFLHCTENIDIHMGTFSKAFAVSGGFVAGSKEMMNYLRYYSRPYFFSASFPPSTAAAVIACLDVMENEPWLQERLLDNVAYAVSKLRRFGLYAPAEGGFLTLNLPENMNVRKAALMFHEKGIFLNAIEYPAVEVNKQRFRISFMSSHIKDDIDRLADTVEEIWNSKQAYTFL